MFSIILISCLGIIVYSNTFHCPFQFDDRVFIIDNPAIRNISNLQDIWNFMPGRFITFLSIAFNYHFHQLNVFGYHLVNLAVHLISAVLVWQLTLLTLATPLMKEDKITRHAGLIALLAGLIFVSHPVQTEAITYIWQRTASMAAMFYLACLCLYVKSRLLKKRSYYICSLLTAVAAMFTKETAITLPLMILLYDHCFLETNEKRPHSLWKRTLPFLLTLFIIPLTALFTKGTAPTEPCNISCAHYLLTQFRVMITYIRLVFIPFHQDLDYGYPVFKNIFELPVLTSLLFLMAVLYCAKRLFSKYRLVSFSIFWFFLTLLPESSLLPLKDVIFEHRLYLPMAGYSMFLASGMYYLWGKNDLKTMVKVMVLIMTCYSILTYQRNNVWKDELSLWDDTVRKSPDKERPYNNRGLAWDRLGNLSQAISDYSKAIEINPRYTNAYVNRGFTYSRENNLNQALSDYNNAIAINPGLAEAYINRANIYLKLRDIPHALSDYNKAVELKAGYEDVYYNLGFIYYEQGDFARSVLNYTKAIELNPEDTQAYHNRALSYYRLKGHDQAQEAR